MKKIAILLAVLLLYGNEFLFGQGATDAEILSFARNYSDNFQIKKDEAVRLALQKGWPVRQEFQGGRIIDIMEIGPNGMPEYETTDNEDAAITSGTNNLWPGGTMGLSLTGDIMLIGEWDGGGVRASHQEFRVGVLPSRVTQRDAPAGTSNHSTHVAGTLIAEGQILNAHGMAPEADLDAYDWDNDISEMGTAYVNDALKLSNHSYGRVRGWDPQGGFMYWFGDITVSTTEDYQFGFYGPLAKTWDSLARLCPQYLICKSAGNDRDDDWNSGHYVLSGGSWVWSTDSRDPDGGTDGYDCMENRAVAKNILTVGAVEQITGGYTQPSDVIMTGFSCWGPTDDGRIKPDIVADGDGLYSSISTTDNSYDTYGGTSMSTPTVCGSLALLQEYHYDLNAAYMYADELKALVINTADEAGPADGPDYQFGWGLLNTDRAAAVIRKDDSIGSLIRRSYLANGETETFTYYSDGNHPLKVTICWIDPAHDALTPALNPTTICLVHDLDLRVINPSGGIAYPWHLNPSNPSSAATRTDNDYDNVETVYLPTPSPGQYTIQVNHEGSISGQYYGLVVSGLQTQRFTNTWTAGYSDDYWFRDGNWSLGHSPVIDEDAVIPTGSSFHSIVDVADGECYSLYVGSDAWLEIRDDSLTIDQNFLLWGELEMDHDDGRLIINGSAFNYTGATIDIQTPNSMIWVSGSWRFYGGVNAQLTNGIVNFTGTGISYIYSYDDDASFNKLGIYKTGGGYAEHADASNYPLRINNYFYLHNNSEFRSNTTQPIIVKGYFSKASTATCNLNMGTIVMDGTATNIIFNGTGYFHDLTISPTTSITLQNDIAVHGNLLIEQGTLIAGNHKIHILGNWTNTVGDAGFTEAGSRVIFDNGDGNSNIDSDENFDTLDIAIFDAVYINNATDSVTCDHFYWTGGSMNVSTGSFTADDLVQSGIYGGWIVSGTGTVNLHQDVGQYIDLFGFLNISGGTMNVWGGNDDSYWGAASGTSVSISSGILDFVNWGVKVYNAYPITENITGGTIKTARVFNVYRPDFNPTGGTIEFRSSADGYISHDAGSNFYSILINKFSKGASSDGVETTALDRQPPGRRNIEMIRSLPEEYNAVTKSRSDRGNIVILQSNLDVNGDITINNGILDVSASNYSINIAGNWTNNVDLVGFNERSGTVTFDGASAKDITTSETFYNLVLDKTYTGILGLELLTGNLVKVNNNLNINDGTLEINPNSILDISGNLTIALGAALNADDNPTTIRIEGNWTDNNATFTSTTGFYAGYYSTALFYGSADQSFSTAGTTGILNNLTIDKATSTFRSNENLEIRGDMIMLTGSWFDALNFLTHSFRGDFTVSSGANFYSTSGNTCKFIGSSDQVITFDPVLTGGAFYDVVIDKSIARGNLPGDRENRANLVTLETDIIALNSGNLTVNYGTLDLNGHYFRAVGDVKIYSGGKISIDDDAWLEVGGSDSLIVFNGGILEVIGSDGHEAIVEGHNDLNYTFEVRSGGTISALHAIFEETGSAGLYVQSGGLIDATNDFDYCTFQNGQAAAAALLRIDNTQTITVDSAYFPTSTTTKNVSKTLNQGNVTFVGATGAFAGPAYEDDAFARIHWAEYGRWEGTTSNNWNTITNWGFDLVPTSLVDVVIPAGCPNYPLLTGNLGVNTADYPYDCKSLEVLSGGRLTTSAYDIISYGIVTSSGDLDIGDDYTAYSGSVLNINGDTTRFGNGSITGIITLRNGAVVNQSGGHLMAEAYTFINGCQFNGNGGYTHLSRFGTAPATQNIVISDPDSYFDIFKVDEGASGSMSTSSQDMVCNTSLAVFGTFDNFGKTVYTEDMIVYGSLAIDSGLVTVVNYGPWFMENSDFNMTGGTLDGADDIIWFFGSSAVASGGSIYCGTNWQFNNGCNVQLGAGNTVYFNDPDITWIFCYSDNASFGTVEFNKPAGNGGVITLGSPYPMEVAGNLYIRNGNSIELQSRDLNVQGELVNEAGSEIYMYTGADLMNNLDFTLNGTLSNSGGNVLIHGNFQEAADGIITLNGGSFICDHAYASRAMYYIYGDFNMSSGTFEISHNHLNFNASATENITGGTIRVGGSFIATAPNFTPSGGTVEMITFTGGGYPYIELNENNYLQNLTISGTNTWLISGSGPDELHIMKDLTINSGCLNGNDDIVYIGDDWTNNVGTSGFVYGTGTVYLNGTTPTPERQVISGTTTFYNLINNNVNAIVEFAGPITINYNYNAASGGAACETFITGTPISIQNLLLTQGAFGLSTSAPVITAGLLTQGGNVQVTNGNFTANELAENYIGGTYTIYDGQINLHQDAVQYVDLNAAMNIHGGVFNIYGGGSDSYWPYGGSGSLAMDGGILDFKSVGIYLYDNSFSENISGGLIRTVGYFTTPPGITFFTPQGGAVELYGDASSQVSLQPGCYFHDLYSSKNVPRTVFAASNLTIKGELRVKSSVFRDDSYVISVGN